MWGHRNQRLNNIKVIFTQGIISCLQGEDFKNLLFYVYGCLTCKYVCIAHMCLVPDEVPWKWNYRWL